MSKEIIVALATPYDEQGLISESRLKALIEFNIESGCDGFFVGGSSGEAPMLSFEERVLLFQLVKKYSGNQLLIANVSSTSLNEAVEYSNKAKEIGYDYISMVAPYYFNHTNKEVADFVIEVMEQSNMEMIFYNFPKITNFEIDFNDEDILRLLTHSKLKGIKHTNKNLKELDEFARINPELKLYCGYDEVYIEALDYGVCGAIGSSFNFLTGQFKEISNCYCNNERSEAILIHEKCNDVMDRLVEFGLISSIKYSLELLGIPVGVARKPFMEISESSKLILESTLIKSGVIR